MSDSRPKNSVGHLQNCGVWGGFSCSCSEILAWPTKGTHYQACFFFRGSSCNCGEIYGARAWLASLEDEPEERKDHYLECRSFGGSVCTCGEIDAAHAKLVDRAHIKRLFDHAYGSNISINEFRDIPDYKVTHGQVLQVLTGTGRHDELIGRLKSLIPVTAIPEDPKESKKQCSG